MKSFFISTPIYYVNAKPHLGHAYTTILADCINRFHRMLGEECFFLTGTDEHGEKIVQAAEEKGQAPQAYADLISSQFKDLWPQLDIEYNYFIRTTYEDHKSCVQKFLQHVYLNGDIYFGEYGGYYCYGCETFYTEKELVDGLCPDHLSAPQYIREENYFFRMSKYQNWLKEHIQTHPEFIQPKQYAGEVLAMLREPLDDLCISRPKRRLSWGIELPFDPEYVTYVWFDALINYISALGWPEGESFRKFWTNAHHVVAKDILKPHAIFWPTMLRSAGLETFRALRVHGYWKVDERKMSKSLGNVVEPLTLSSKYGVDAFRYFLLREMHFGHDGSFSEKGLIDRFNADLANDLGNLFNRTLSMMNKYFKSEVPQAGEQKQEDRELVQLGLDCMSEYVVHFQNFKIAQALQVLWDFVRGLNKYIDETAPWSLFKSQEKHRLATVMSVVLAGLRKVSLALWPVMPRASEKMLSQLAVEFSADNIDMFQESRQWVNLASGTALAKKSKIFPRQEFGVEDQTEEQRPQESEAGKGTVQDEKAEIEFGDFQKLDLRIGQVVEAEAIPEADKLLRLLVDVGEGKSRQIVAGLAEYFQPDELVGLQVVVVVNLKARKVRGVISEAMVLAVHDKSGLKLIKPSHKVLPGSKVS